MSVIILIFFLAVFAVRLFSLSISISNGKRLKKEGAVEYGTRNSMVLSILHVTFYVGSIVEAAVKKTQFDIMTVVGICIYLAAISFLFIVIYQLKDVWTVKLFIAKKHTLNTGFLFKYIRHPNYFLNIIPELVALSLICKSWTVLTFVFPFYVVSLITRIVQEEKIMKETFANY